MRRYNWFLLSVVAVLAGSCAGLREESSVAQDWTTPLTQLGLAQAVDTWAAPKDWELREVSNEATPPGGAAAASITLADLTGPGCVMSLRAANPSGMLHVAIDDAPVFDVRFENLFGDFLTPFRPPLVGQAPGASYSYVPIPFARHCVITLTDAEQPPIYQIRYAVFKEGTALQPFSLALDGAAKRYFTASSRAMDKASRVRFVDRATEKYHHTSMMIWPHKDRLLYTLDGSGTITELELCVNSKDPGVLRQVWLKVYWDGQASPSILAPLDEFFGADTLAAEWYAVPGMAKHGLQLRCRLPMPFASGARIQLENRSESKIDFAYDLTWRPGLNKDARYFHARYNEVEVLPGQPFKAATIQGAGLFLGCRLGAQRENAFQLVDGNTSLLVDGKPLMLRNNLTRETVLEGVGTGPLVKAVHGGISAFGGSLNDAAPFKQSLECAVEGVTGDESAKVLLSGVVFWYQTQPNGDPWVVPGFEPKEKEEAAE